MLSKFLRSLWPATQALFFYAAVVAISLVMVFGVIIAYQDSDVVVGDWLTFSGAIIGVFGVYFATKTQTDRQLNHAKEELKHHQNEAERRQAKDREIAWLAVRPHLYEYTKRASTIFPHTEKIIDILVKKNRGQDGYMGESVSTLINRIKMAKDRPVSLQSMEMARYLADLDAKLKESIGKLLKTETDIDYLVDYLMQLDQCRMGAKGSGKKETLEGDIASTADKIRGLVSENDTLANELWETYKDQF